MKYGILFGGRSHEHDISIITATQAAACLRGDVYPIYARDGAFYLVRGKMDVKGFANKTVKLRRIRFDTRGGKCCIVCGIKRIFLDGMLMCCHGGEGEDGRFSALMDVYDVPHTASDTLASAVTMDKRASKIWFDRYGFPNARGVFLKEGDDLSAVDELTYPLIVKPARLGSSIGIDIAHNAEELAERLAVAFSFDTDVVVEEVIPNAVEYNCAAFIEKGEVILSAVESPRKWHDFLTFEDKYQGGKYKFGTDAPLPDEISKKVQMMTERIYRAFGLFGIARVDFLYDPAADILYVNEINSQPGSLAYYLFEKAGIPFPLLLERVLSESRRRRKGIIHFNSNVLDNLCVPRAK